MVVQVLAQIVGSVLVPQGGALGDLGVAVAVATQPLPMLAATVAILRYRLWEIDIVVSRALVYGVLWAALSALLLVPPLAAGLLVGGRGALAAVGLALLVTVVFQPSRRGSSGWPSGSSTATAPAVCAAHRLLGDAAHRRPRPDRLAARGRRARRARRRLGRRLALAAAASGGSLRPLGIAGAQAGLPASSPPRRPRRLRDSPGLVLTGLPEPELEGLWPRRRQPSCRSLPPTSSSACSPAGRGGATRSAPPTSSCWSCSRASRALRLRNLRLEAQLRERLGQIEAQADELQRSRRRLVTAQDEERRRIERNLHDGVQQQLVSLAVRLQRAAGGDAVLADLAGEAEQAVFALQELARGIYPSVLADQGLPAALRTQAARLPMAVTVDVDPALAGRRLDAELEAALYFVALEALTNAQKHAPQAAVAVGLHADDGRVGLEVVDNGPGFDAARPGRGSGLQNMADRMAAAGGTFELESRAGAGTRIVAAVPAGEELRQADSRR